LENAARCQLNPPPATPVKRCPPEAGPSVPSNATTRVLGWDENTVDEIDEEGEFCCVTEVDMVVAARVPGPPSSKPSSAVTTVRATNGAAPSFNPMRPIGILSGECNGR
jgi:hypothetical protein